MDELTAHFEQALEMDVHRLVEEVKERRDQPELSAAGDRELVKQAIQSMNDTSAPAVHAPVPANATVVDNPLPDYASAAPAETKLEIEYLLELAFKKGIIQANREAGKSSAFVRDAFHDALAGKLYPLLQKRGMVK